LGPSSKAWRFAELGRLALSDAEEDALVAFMQTLTDGFMPVQQ
jgi:cytochrome c peroxidase